jgi:cephalosporin-C deacetylase-like acetyl esterase
MSTDNQHQHLVNQLKALTPTYRFDERWEGDVAGWREGWQRKFVELVGSGPPRCEPNPRWEKLEDRERYALHRVTYATEPGLDAFAFVAIPHDINGRVPAVLCPHGHGQSGARYVAAYGDDPAVAEEVRGYNGDYGHRLAERGVIAFMPNMRGFGDRLSDKERQAKNRDTCNVNFMYQMLLGQCALTCQLRELQVALDIMTAMQQVDPDAIGCAGLSYGGRLTMYIAALDPRIKAAVVSGALNSMAERLESYASCGYQMLPGMLLHGDTPEVFGLIAPRALAIEAGNADHGCCPQPMADELYARIHRMFAAQGVDSQLALFKFDGGHIFDGERSIPWLLEQLR